MRERTTARVLPIQPWTSSDAFRTSSTVLEYLTANCHCVPQAASTRSAICPAAPTPASTPSKLCAAPSAAGLRSCLSVSVGNHQGAPGCREAPCMVRQTAGSNPPGSGRDPWPQRQRRLIAGPSLQVPLPGELDADVAGLGLFLQNLLRRHRGLSLETAQLLGLHQFQHPHQLPVAPPPATPRSPPARGTTPVET